MFFVKNVTLNYLKNYRQNLTISGAPVRMRHLTWYSKTEMITGSQSACLQSLANNGWCAKILLAKQPSIY